MSEHLRPTLQNVLSLKVRPPTPQPGTELRDTKDSLLALSACAGSLGTGSRASPGAPVVSRAAGLLVKEHAGQAKCSRPTARQQNTNSEGGVGWGRGFSGSPQIGGLTWGPKPEVTEAWKEV